MLCWRMQNHATYAQESYTAREEMGAQLLSYQQHIIDLERRLEQEKRGR